MEKFNIAELLKDCPKGMELDCMMCDNLSYDYIDKEQNRIYCKVDLRDTVWFTVNGCVNLSPSAKCVIFPKGKTTWDGFVPPYEFKDGDIVATANGIWIGIVKKPFKGAYETYITICDDIVVNNNCVLFFDRLATEEEKQKLFDTIKANGYKWNAETKTLEKLTEQKFNITTLKPFESKVLVRGCNSQEWVGEIFTRYNNKVFDNCNFVTLGGICWKQCIPYNDETKHLLGNTSDCDEYYKTWE